jgi:DeoR family suf operon transcriptional repressor
MAIQVPTSDGRLLDVLRVGSPLGVIELADQFAVTPTAVRQRLMRLMAEGLVQREAVRNGPGRPRHMYRLTDKGLRLTGSNFADLALALWREIGRIGDEGVRREMLRRVAGALARQYADQVRGITMAERMQSLGELLGQRRIPISVRQVAHRLVLTAHACPYPRLAEQDRAVCVMEEMLFSELLGQEVRLSQCRLDGDPECCFCTEQPAGVSEKVE